MQPGAQDPAAAGSALVGSGEPNAAGVSATDPNATAAMPGAGGDQAAVNGAAGATPGQPALRP